MCKYIYEYRKHQLSGSFCLYPSFYSKYSEELSTIKALPIDEDGYCLFHSENRSWKIKNHFYESFNELLILYEDLQLKKDIPKWLFNFSGFKFPLKDGNNKDNNFIISCQSKNATLDFSFCKFWNDVSLEGFINSITMDGSRFYEKLKIGSVIFNNNVSFTNSLFNSDIKISDCSFNGYTYFDDCTFNNVTKNPTFSVRFKDCNVNDLNFENSTFEINLVFEKTVFNAETVFEHCKFLHEFYFIDNTVLDTISFKQAGFLLSEKTNSQYSTVDLRGLNISKTGRLIFKGKIALDSVVKGELNINFASPPEGIISFENFNLNSIKQLSKSKLFELEKTGQVEIGLGCRKYYCQTDILIVKATRPNQNLILDLVKVFCNYFEINNTYNLGVEIVERHVDLMKYFFYTDEMISKDEFEFRIKKNESELWQTFSKLSTYSSEQLEISQVLVRNELLGIATMFFKIRNRILASDYFEDDFKQLLNSISTEGKSVIDANRSYPAILDSLLILPALHTTSDKTLIGVQRTVHPIHFEDMSGKQFERLIFAFVARCKNWNTIQWLGETGGDGGRDIWGTLGDETYCYQCANYKRMVLKKITDDIDKLVKWDTIPSHYVVVCSNSVSTEMRKNISSYAKKSGILNTEVWSGVEVEEKLRRHSPDLLKRFVEGEVFPNDSIPPILDYW